MQKRKYGSMFIYGTFQFAGNTEEYFAKYSRKLVVFIVLPRLHNTGNVIRLYKNGALHIEKKVRSSENFFMYYALWYIQYLEILLRYYSKKEKIIVLSGHPISFLGMTIQKLLRNIVYVYWVADYFPPNTMINKFFMYISNFYNKRIPYRAYLSDTLNEKINGKVIASDNIKTIMWGIKESKIHRKNSSKFFSLCFIGVIRPSQGLEETLHAIKDSKNVSLKIIGACDDVLYKKLTTEIKRLHLTMRVFFPNKFYYGKELEKVIDESTVGVALYDVGPEHGTYYADPAKIKTYTQYGLPVLMTNAADIAKFIKKNNAGEVVNRDKESIAKAIERLKKDYNNYVTGVEKFNRYFSYEKYYGKKFEFLTKL